jgi:protein gp37
VKKQRIDGKPRYGVDDGGNWKSRAVFNGKINLIDGALTIPLRRKKPTMYFVNSMSDLFHKDVPFEFVDKVFAVMALCPQHTFQVLTKRPERMAEYCAMLMGRGVKSLAASERFGTEIRVPESFPLPNVWLGTSVEDQQRKTRIDEIRNVPAAIRFLSLEPLLEDLGTLDLTGIHWVIVGGESGPGARPCNVDWVRAIVGQCKATGIAAFVKQLGAHVLWDGIQGGYLNGVPNVWPDGTSREDVGGAWRVHLKDGKGANQYEWPEDLRVRQFPADARRIASELGQDLPGAVPMVKAQEAMK